MQLATDLIDRQTYVKYTNPEEASGKSHLPEVQGEESHFYIKLKERAPVQYVNILSVTFAKQCFTPMKKEGDIPKVCFPVFSFSENQKEALMIRSKTKKIAWWEGTQKKTVFASDFIEILPLPDGDYKDRITSEEIADILTKQAMSVPTEAQEENKKRRR